MDEQGEPGAKKKTGPKRKDGWQQTYLDEIEKNGVSGLACKRAGVGETTVRRTRQRDEAFALAEADARERGLDGIEALLRMRGTSGQPIRKTRTVRRLDPNGDVLEVTETEETELLISTPAAMFLLKRYRPEFRDTFKVENTGRGGGPIKVERVDSAVDELFAELDRLRDD